MRRALRALTFVTALLATLAAPSAPANAATETTPDTTQRQRGFEKVGYFTQWGIYRGFFVKRVADSGAAARLTTINYAFGNVSADGRCFEVNRAGEGDAWADYQRPFPTAESVDGVADAPGQALAGNFNQLRKLKARFPHLKVLMSLGGWTWSTYFSNAALTPQSRRAFVESCIDLFIKGNLPQLDGDPHGGPGTAHGVFDGFDLDWEWPNWPGEDGNVIRPEDRRNFTLLLAEFRRQLDALGRRTGGHLPLTAFLPANPAAMDAGFEGRRIFRHLDYATVQGYDFHGTWENLTNHQSAIFEPAGAPTVPDFTLDRTVRSWLERGAPRAKIVAGMPYFGRGWTGVDNMNAGLFQRSTGPAPGTFEPGFDDYRVLATLPASGFTVYRDFRAGHAWLFNGSTFWTFDDPVVIAQKALYIRSNRLGGSMVWSLDGDDDQATLTRTIDLVLR